MGICSSAPGGRMYPFWNCSPVHPPNATQKRATAATARQRAIKPRGEGTREDVWPNSVIPELIPSPCAGLGVDVPGSTSDCNMRGCPINEALGLARGTHDALAVQTLQKTPDRPARHHRGHLWHDRDASARTVVLPGLGRARHG